jgi:deferrochelatase/peroxidase EfeB
VSGAFDPSDLQGNILRGYKRERVRHLLLGVADRASAGAFLGAAAAGGRCDVPAITTESEKRWSQTPEGLKPDACFNVGLTHDGLKALGASPDSLATFPTEFIEGMAKRAVKLGDFGESAPERWTAPFDRPERIHVVASVYADDPVHIDRVQAQVARAFTVLGAQDGRSLPGNRVFFGYIDGISQPRFEGVHDRDLAEADQPPDPLGTALLGHPTRLERLIFRVPSPSVLGFNGSFNAFRVLAQDCLGFEAYLTEAAEQLVRHAEVDKVMAPGGEARIGAGLDRAGALREIVAAQMCGRWRLNGAPLANAPDGPIEDERKGFLTNFDYTRASACPVGAHVRRSNPRGGPIVQRISNRTRRLVRRGMVYGPDFDPARPDGADRGLLGNFIGASLGAQFEAVMYDWLNLGLQDPDITGSNDALIGANSPETSWFDLRTKDGGAIRLHGFPRFVTTRGGAYTFLPSLPAIAYLAGLAEQDDVHRRRSRGFVRRTARV